MHHVVFFLISSPSSASGALPPVTNAYNPERMSEAQYHWRAVMRMLQTCGRTWGARRRHLDARPRNLARLVALWDCTRRVRACGQLRAAAYTEGIDHVGEGGRGDCGGRERGE